MPTRNLIPALLITVILAVSFVLTAIPVSAVSPPPIPSWTVQYIDHSYDVPLTYTTSIDPYTGEEIKTPQGGYRVTSITVDVTIHRQNINPGIDEENHTLSLYYNVRAKGHFEDWYGEGGSHGMSAVAASTTGDTVVSFDVQNWGIKQGGQIDFQVEAILGYTDSSGSYCGSASFHTVQVSGWSGTQTVTYGNPISATPTPNNWVSPTATPYYSWPDPTATPTQNPIFPDNQIGQLFSDLSEDQTSLIVVAIVALLAVVGVLILMRRINKK
jgi:hypothetical protein